ncbi:response regulator transcription factor [Peribacillus simplex]|uniref:response regulator transcription factor n=1 Tax=Peribacillus simplex TaxID=1478 RepID=UPI003D2E3B98
MKRKLNIAIIDRNLALINQTHLYLKASPISNEVVHSICEAERLVEILKFDRYNLDIIIMSDTNLLPLNVLNEYLLIINKRKNKKKKKPVVIIFDDTKVEIKRIHLMWEFSNSIILNREKQDLLLAIQSVSNGAFYYSKEFSGYSENTGYFRNNVSELPLTKTEKSVVKELIRDKTNQEIADTLFMSRRTVEYHITSCIQKFEVNSRVGLAVKAIGMLEKESLEYIMEPTNNSSVRG